MASPTERPPGAGRRLLRHAASWTPQYVVVLVVIVSLNFALPRLMPGNPVVLVLGEDAALVSEEARAEAAARLGLDRPLHEQYVAYLGELARAELGHSFRWRKPVGELIRERLPWTLLLVGTAIAVSTVIGVAAGTLAAWRRARRTDTASLAGFLTLDALPAFWVGILLLLVFGVSLGVAPVFGARSPGAGFTGLAYAWDVARHVALPAATLVLASVGGMFLVTRYAVLGVIREDYVMVARAKGLAEPAVALRHALPAAALPIVTVVLLRIGFLVGGAVVVETVFTYPGLGRLIMQAAASRDYAVMQGAFLVLALTVLAANLVADLLYPLLDPRVGGRDR